MLDGEEARLARLYQALRERLLDLTKRNQLLNYRFSARSRRFVQVVDGSLEAIYCWLVSEQSSLRIKPLPEPDEIPRDERTDEFRAALDHSKVTDVEYLAALEALETAGRSEEIEVAKIETKLRERVREHLGLPPRPLRKEINRIEHAKSLGIDPNIELRLSCEAIGERILQTLKFPDELEAIMEKISADARLAEQEMGLSTLYLAFGFLEWFESEASDKNAFSPLLLLPVRLEVEKVRGKSVYSISAREGDAEANLSLQKLLEKEFNRALPDFQVSETEAVASVEQYFGRVKTAIEELKRWQVHRWLVLGHFAFGRFAMYADLAAENWGGAPAAYTLVRSVVRRVDQASDPDKLQSVPEDYSVDEPEFEKIAPYLIQDADASQHSAIIDVMRGNNLVIQGPPGTGKSQNDHKRHRQRPRGGKACPLSGRETGRAGSRQTSAGSGGTRRVLPRTAL